MRSRVAVVLCALLANGGAVACSLATVPPLLVAPTGEEVLAHSADDTVFVAEVRGSFREPWRVGVFVKVTDAVVGSFSQGELVEIEFMGGDYICAYEAWHSAQEVKVEAFKAGSRVLVLLRRSGKPLRVHTEEFGVRFRVIAEEAG